MYLSSDKKRKEEYLVLLKLNNVPTTKTIIAIKETLEKASDNMCKLLSSSSDTTQLCFVLKSNLRASAIQNSLLGGTLISETSCLGDKDSVLVTVIGESCSWWGDEFHKNLFWALESRMLK